MGRRGKAIPSRGGAAKSGAGNVRRGDKQAARRRRRGEGADSEDFEELARQLRPMGLHVKKMDADGNCLFRAFADQVGGDCEEHQQYRDDCCEMMLANLEEFELFYAEEEDEAGESFEAYVHRMRHPGRWGSQLELMALCRHYGVNAIVHQSGRPAYEMDFAPREARCIQLSYHDGEHYNSIRFAWDLAAGEPAQFLTLQMLRGTDSVEGSGGAGAEEPEDVQQVRECLPPGHALCVAAVRAALARAGNDVTLAAEYLLTDEFGGSGSVEESSEAVANEKTSARTCGEASATPQLADDPGSEQAAGSAATLQGSTADSGATPAHLPALASSRDPEPSPAGPSQQQAPPGAADADPAESTATAGASGSSAQKPPRRAKDAAGRKRRAAQDRARAAAAGDAAPAKRVPDADSQLSLLAQQLLSV